MIGLFASYDSGEVQLLLSFESWNVGIFTVQFIMVYLYYVIL